MWLRIAPCIPFLWCGQAMKSHESSPHHTPHAALAELFTIPHPMCFLFLFVGVRLRLSPPCLSDTSDRREI